VEGLTTHKQCSVRLNQICATRPSLRISGMGKNKGENAGKKQKKAEHP